MKQPADAFALHAIYCVDPFHRIHEEVDSIAVAFTCERYFQGTLPLGKRDRGVGKDTALHTDRKTVEMKEKSPFIGKGHLSAAKG